VCHGLFDLGQRNRDGVVTGTAGRLRVQRHPRGGLQGSECAASVSTCHPYDVVPRLWFEAENPCQSTLLDQCGGENLIELGVGQRLESDQHGPRQQRCDDAEGRVLGGRRDQHHEAVLHPGQQSVLLCLGEPVYLVQEQDRLPVVHVPLPSGDLHDRPDVLDTGGDGRQLHEPASGRSGHEVRQRRLACPWRAPDDRGQRAGRAIVPLDQPPQRAACPQDVCLSPDLLEAAGAHPGGERRQRSRSCIAAG